jgi:hemerythrin-like domain-containing protein
MDVIELLKRQHEEVRDVLERMIAEDDARESRMLLSQVSSAMRLHMAIEEKIVYPAASRAFAGDEDDEETILESYEEHAVVRRCLETLEGTAPSDKRFVVRTKIVKDLFEHHVEEEENEMFPELEAKLGQDGIRKLGDLVERRLGDLEGEGTRGRAARARRGQRAGRARAGRSGRAAGAAAGRRAASGARGRGAKTRQTARKATSRTKSTTIKTNGSRESNGNKPRRGESTSRH